MIPIEKSKNTGNRILSRVPCKSAFLFSSFLLIVMWATTAFAQYTTARLSGTVQDNTGAAVPGATVIVKQAGTGYKQASQIGSRRRISVSQPPRRQLSTDG